MPVNYVPLLHTELPEDLAFTKKQDDVKDPREFNYSHFIVISKYTVAQAKMMKASPEEIEARMNLTYRREKASKETGVKRQQVDTSSPSAERLYYHWEDSPLLASADMSFTYLSTFREIDEDGKKHNYLGSFGTGLEKQYRIVYLISAKNYYAKIAGLSKLC
jgi:hypothetical protein